MANDNVAVTPERPREHRENRKKNIGRKVEDNQAMAVAKFIRVPPRKARLVMDEIRGMYAIDALAFLRYIPNRAATYITKVLESAMANAANNHDLTVENLKLVSGRVDDGPRIKRVRPRAQGRAYRILKRMSHITVIVQEAAPKPRKPRKQTGTRAQAARAARKPAETPAPAIPAAEAVKPTAVAEEPTPAEETVVETTAAEITAEETTAAPETAAEDTTSTETAEATTEAEEQTSEPAEPEAETK